VEEMQEPAPGHGPAAAPEPAELLGELRLLRRRTRVTRHAYWFPLVLFGVLICASAPFYLQPGGPAGSGQAAAVTGPSMPLLGGLSGFLVSRYLGYYWLTALFAGLLLTLLWYRRHARQVGLATPARGYIITSAVLTVLAFLLPPLSQLRPLRWLQVLWPGDLVIRGTFPFLIIAAGLWVLARAERSRPLAVIALIYTAAALLASLYNVENVLFRLGWTPSPGQWRLTSLPGVLLPALVLLVAGVSAFAVQRPHRTPR
jgi:hypothetical protein